MPSLLAILFSINTSQAKTSIVKSLLLNKCNAWTKSTSENKVPLEKIARNICHQTVESGSFQEGAYQVCLNLKRSSRYLDSHPIYSFEKCLSAINSRTFSEDNLAVISEYSNKLSLYALVNAFESADNIKNVPPSKSYVSCREVAQHCEKWVKENQGEDAELGKVARNQCIVTAVSGNFHKNNYEICSSLPVGTRTSEAHPVYSFQKCLKSIINQEANSEKLEYSNRRCKQLQLETISPQVKSELFEELLGHLK